MSRDAAPTTLIPPKPDTDGSASFRLNRTDYLALLLIPAAAFILRLIFLLQSKSSPLFDKIIMDARSYWEWSDRLVAGDWVGKDVFYQAPLYPYLLGGLKLVFGADLWAIKVVQIALGSVACAFVYLAALLWFTGSPHRRAIAIASAAMLAIYPPVIFYDAIIQKANLGLVLTALLLWLLARACAMPGLWRSAAVGIVLGLLMLTREESILLVPVLAIVLAIRGRTLASRHGMLIAPAALLLGAAVTLAPVGIRNHHVGGRFVLTTSQAGPNFYIGNNPNATGMYAPLRPGRSNTPFERRDAFELAEQALGRTLTPSEVDAYWRGRAFDFITGDPIKWLRLIGRKALLLVNAFEIPDAESQEFAARSSSLLRGLGTTWHFGVLVPLAGAGLVLTWSQRRTLWPLYLVILTTAGAVVLFYVFGRYRSPLIPMLMPFAAAAVILGIACARERRFPALALAGAAALPLAILANLPLFDRQQELAAICSNAGSSLADAGDDAGAITLFREALALKPDLPDTIANMAQAQARLGRLPDALASMQQALAMRPDDPRMHFRIGTLKAQLGDLPAATAHLQKAVAGGPQDVDSATNLSAVLLESQRWAEATAHLRTATVRFPKDVGFHANLAFLLASCPDENLRNGAEAVSFAQKAIALAPAPSADLYDILGAAEAQTGNYTHAIASATQALQIAKADPATPPELIASIQANLDRYRVAQTAPQQTPKP